VLRAGAAAAPQVVVGLSLVILLFRARGNVLLENASDLKG